MKYQCDIPGFEECYIELSERWTRGELKAFFAETGDAYLDLVRNKITACYLTTEGGGVIAKPEHLTNENIDLIDIWLWKWFGTAVAVGVDELYSMGEAHARRWSGEYAKQMDERRAKAKLN
jgi:hypothetical protein